MHIKSRDGELRQLNPLKIREAVAKAARGCQSVESNLVTRVTAHVSKEMSATEALTWEVEQIQDLVVNTLVSFGAAEVAVKYIQHRMKRAQVREGKRFVQEAIAKIQTYVSENDWKTKENANLGYSVQGLNTNISEEIIKAFWLEQYSATIRDSHLRGDLHIHDLGFLGNYCCGWDLKDLLIRGFGGVAYKVESAPPKHFRTALGQLVNFLYTMQGEAAGAQAVSSIDTLLAPFIAFDNLSYKDVFQAMQEFIFNLNVPTRVGFQTPFTNVTLDIVCPESMKTEAVVCGGKYRNETYGAFQKEMDMFNKAFCEVMLQGDSAGRIFGYPIPTYNVTKSWDWESPRLEGPFKMASKYGIPYFSNFISSDMDPDDARSMCCRLRLDNRELQRRGGGLFGANPLTGSIGVVTLNLPLAAMDSGSVENFKDRVTELVGLAAESLEQKRKTLEKLFEHGMYPYSRVYLDQIYARHNSYLGNHFSTVGLIGMHEALQNLGIEHGIRTSEGRKIAEEVLTVMRDLLQEQQVRTGSLYNLEATPAESTCYRAARKAKRIYSNIITSGTEETPYFTNSSQLPVDMTTDLFEALTHQDPLQNLYTGGTVLHGFLGEEISDWTLAKTLVRKVFEQFRLPYFSLTPTFSICPSHGYLTGEQFNCPTCNAETEVWSRITGFYRPLQRWNDGKAQEYRERTEFQRPEEYLPQSKPKASQSCAEDVAA